MIKTSESQQSLASFYHVFANRFEPNAKEIAAYSEANLLSRDSNFFPSKGFLSPTRGQILSDDNG